MWAGLLLLRVKRMRERELHPWFTASAGPAKSGGRDGKLIVSGVAPPLNRASDPCDTLWAERKRVVCRDKRQRTLELSESNILLEGRKILHTFAHGVAPVHRCCSVCSVAAEQFASLQLGLKICAPHWATKQASKTKDEPVQNSKAPLFAAITPACEQSSL